LIMWLQKDERILLRYYYSQGRADYICQRDPDILIEELRKRKNQTEKQQVDETYVMNALGILQKHSLIQNVKRVHDTGQIQVKLTREAIDPGRKYGSTIGTLGVWFTEYTWLWIIIGLAIGVITIVVAVLKN